MTDQAQNFADRRETINALPMSGMERRNQIAQLADDAADEILSIAKAANVSASSLLFKALIRAQPDLTDVLTYLSRIDFARQHDTDNHQRIDDAIEAIDELRQFFAGEAA